MRRVAAIGVLVALPAVAALPAAAQEPPRLRLVDGTRLVLRDLPPTLGREEIVRHLDSGLTTSLVFTVEPVGLDATGTATVQVRYELWDELYLVAAIDGAGRVERSSQGSLRELDTWWADLELPVLELPVPELAVPDAAVRDPGVPDAVDPASRPRKARVTLDVIPFSLSEQVDARRWFAETVRRAEQGRRDGASRPVEETGGSVEQVFDVLIATSIRRRAVISTSWTLEISEEPPP